MSWHVPMSCGTMAAGKGMHVLAFIGTTINFLDFELEAIRDSAPCDDRDDPTAIVYKPMQQSVFQHKALLVFCF